MKIPKHLRHLLLQRGGMERITQELAARNAIREKPNIVYSTQQTEPQRKAENKNKGCCPASTAIKNYNPLDDATSGRTAFKSECTGKLGQYRTVSFQEHKVHVQGEKKRK